VSEALLLGSRTSVGGMLFPAGASRGAYPSPDKGGPMSNTLVTELRSMTAAVLTATTAAERGNWREAKKGVSDIRSRAHRVVVQLASTEQELRGDGQSRLEDNPDF
jgi:hypothetical protein